MQAFSERSGMIAVYAADHVDTDRIIPARFLSMVSRSGFGELLFRDVRGPDFPLDQPEAQGATILVTGTNFGCGSSREHAVWAIQQAGFFAVIARRDGDSPGFSDIFRQNAANCGLLLIELGPTDHRILVEAGTGTRATIDLPAQTVRIADSLFAFEIDPTTKAQIMKGLDLIGTTLEYEDAIAWYESESDRYLVRR